MSRRRASNLAVDMFPFLSVLCTIIGVLMLFILMIISSRVLADHDSSPVAPPPIPPLPPELAAPQDPGMAEPEYERLLGNIRQMTSDLAQRTAELERLKQLALKLEDLIAAKEDDQLVAEQGEHRLLGVQVDKREDVFYQPDANVRVAKAPIFVEITSEQFIVHPNGEKYGVGELKKADSSLATFLADLDKRRKREYLLLLIHENGVPLYHAIREYLLSKYPHPKYRLLSRIDMGAEPFSEGWLLVGEQLAKQRK